jgi:hypothetical protein
MSPTEQLGMMPLMLPGVVPDVSGDASFKRAATE